MSLVPLAERSGINLNHGALDESVGADQFVVAGIVDDTNDACFASSVLGSPSKVSRLESQRTMLNVAATDTNGVNSFGSKFG